MSTLSSRILELLDREMALDDDQLAGRLGIVRQQVNQTCRRLEREGLLIRERGAQGKIVNRLSSKHRESSGPIPPSSTFSDWFWEGNVQEAIKSYLTQQGWTIKEESDTASQQRGVDLVAVLDDRVLAVEVKGYPSTTYARGPKAGQPKPTQPTLQARHWYAGALLSALMLRSKRPSVEIALGFPDFPRYRSLLEKTEWALRNLNIGIYLVQSDRSVEIAVSHHAIRN